MSEWNEKIDDEDTDQYPQKSDDHPDDPYRLKEAQNDFSLEQGEYVEYDFDPRDDAEIKIIKTISEGGIRVEIYKGERRLYYSYRSRKHLLNLPMYAIVTGADPRKIYSRVAVGFFALGQFAKGVFCLAQFGVGVFTVAQFGMGLLFTLSQIGIGAIFVGQIGAGAFFCLAQIGVGTVVIAQLGIGKFVLAMKGVGEHVMDMQNVDPVAKKFFQSLKGLFF